MIVPTRWALGWLALGFLCCALTAVDRRWVLVAMMIDVAVVAVVLWQGRRLRNLDVRVERRWVGQLQAQRQGTCQLRIENRSDRTVEVIARQMWSSSMLSDVERWSAVLPPRQIATFDIEVTPTRRGQLELPDLELDVTTRLGLSAQRRRESDGNVVTVLPNLEGVKAYEKLRRSRAMRSAGFHRQRMIGLGRESDQIREYVNGDDYRDINWKATARTGEPLTNLYRAERSRDIVVCVDGGRMMGNPVGDRTTLDYAVDAAMLLTYAGHDQGDRVGLVTFRDRVDTVLRPGLTNAPSILRTLAEFDSRPVFPSYLALVESLRSRQNHRSLIFILTDLADPQASADLAELMPMLASRHLVVVVSIQDTFAERLAEGPVDSRHGGVSRILAARTIFQEREQRTHELIKSGVQVLQADAEHFSLTIINHYMAVKSRQLL